MAQSADQTAVASGRGGQARDLVVQPGSQIGRRDIKIDVRFVGTAAEAALPSPYAGFVIGLVAALALGAALYLSVTI